MATTYSKQYPSPNTDNPENSSAATTDEGLIFPETLTTEFRHIIQFQRYAYSRTNYTSLPTAGPAKNSSSITLPIPLSLKTEYGASWSNKSIGATGNYVRNKIASLGQLVMKSDFNNATSSTPSASDAAKTSGRNIVQSIAMGAKAVAADALLSNEYGEAAAGALGYARNPFQTMLYEAPEFRSFNFEWKLVAANAAESAIIQKIIKEFKLGMHPSYVKSYQQNIFQYPDMWKITLPDETNLFSIAMCALTSFGVDYHAEGTPTYVRDTSGNTHIPISIQIECSFRELQLLTVDDIEKNY